MTDSQCPCQSGNTFKQCCSPYLAGTAFPATPLALMRSRYTAYRQRNANYLAATWYPPDQHNKAALIESIEHSFRQTEWLGLTIIKAYADSANPRQAFVEFMAYFNDSLSKQKRVLHERSRFILCEQRWFYADGIKPETKRNEPCPCGSGKKYKKCCYPLMAGID